MNSIQSAFVTGLPWGEPANTLALCHVPFFCVEKWQWKINRHAVITQEVQSVSCLFHCKSHLHRHTEISVYNWLNKNIINTPRTALLLKNALFLLPWGYSQETTKMPWFGSRLQDVVDFLLVVKERNIRERAKIVTREESDRRLRVFTVPGKMLDYSLSWGVEAHERFQLQCSDWVNCFWHLERWWWFTVISPPVHLATKKSTGDDLLSGEVVGFSDRLWEVAKALAPNQCGLDSIPGVDGLSLLLAFFSAPRRFSILCRGTPAFLFRKKTIIQIPIRFARKCLQIVGDRQQVHQYLELKTCPHF